ncbi:MAG TPA: hypothetical protein VGS23_07785 [Thermoplasmata archaeon]|nr:hypothetical protein [Thermoplasmata archaeon]
MTGFTVEEERLLSDLHRAIARSPGPVREVEVGVALSIALGKQRPAVSCGGCATPLELEGIPARTKVDLRVPYRLVVDAPGADA